MDGCEAEPVDYEALFDELYPSLLRYLYRTTGDADLAEDIAQEAFARLLRQSVPQEDARPWLFTVAMNLVRDGARQHERRQRLLAKAPITVSSGVPRPDEAVERKEQIQAVRVVLRKLSDRDRQLLLMREEGFQYAEIAKALGVAPASVGTLIGRAFKRFGRLWEEEKKNEGEKKTVDDARE